MRVNSKSFSLFEQLETRRMFAVTLQGDGTLLIAGTKANDVVTVSLSPADNSMLVVKVNNAKPQSFDVDSIDTIQANLGAGNDKFTADESHGPISIPMSVAGGAGNDSITTGSGDDTLNGDVGNDVLKGNAGDDRLNGAVGNDSLNGGDDDDSLNGGVGDDSLAGNNGNDDLDAGAGKNKLTGGGGSDQFASAVAGAKNTITDKAADNVTYTAFALGKVPQTYLDSFGDDVPGATITGIRVNSDKTITTLYQYDGDDTVYHALSTSPGGANPFADVTKITLTSYELPADQLPSDVIDSFFSEHPDGDIKSISTDPQNTVAHIRFKEDDAAIRSEDFQWPAPSVDDGTTDPTTTDDGSGTTDGTDGTGTGTDGTGATDGTGTTDGTVTLGQDGSPQQPGSPSDADLQALLNQLQHGGAQG